MWLAVDRVRNKIIEVEVTENKGFSDYLPMAMRLEENYNIEQACTDYNPTYLEYKVADIHHQTKAETALVESKNSLLRLYLARLNRKTRRFSKAFDALKYSVLIFYKQDMLKSIFV